MPKKTKKVTPPSKANKKVIEDRVSQCLQWINLGWTRQLILREGSIMWKISDRQIDEYCYRAMEICEAQVAKEQKTIASRIHRQLQKVYHNSMFEGEPVYNNKGELVCYEANMAVARQALMDSAKLSGLLRDNVHFSGNLTTGMDATNDEDLDAAWADENK